MLIDNTTFSCVQYNKQIIYCQVPRNDDSTLQIHYIDEDEKCVYKMQEHSGEVFVMYNRLQK